MNALSLPVWATAKQSYGFVRQHPRLLAVPMTLLFLAEFLQEALSDKLLPDAWGRFAATFLLLLIDSAFTVGLLRTVILDEGRPGFRFLRWDFYFWRYLKTVLLATVCVMLIGLAALFAAGAIFPDQILHSGAAAVAGGVAAIPALYLAARLVLAFAGAALGQDKTFRLSWRITRSNGWRLLAVFFLAAVPPSVISVPLTYLAPGLLSTAIGSAVDTWGTAVFTAAIALSYRTLAPATGPSGAEAR
jgi:hypothetical protein